MLLVHLFVCFARVCFCPFSLPLGVEGFAALDHSINFLAVAAVLSMKFHQFSQGVGVRAFQ